MANSSVNAVSVTIPPYSMARDRTLSSGDSKVIVPDRHGRLSSDLLFGKLLLSTPCLYGATIYS
jgi:hypothetical protein